jgi:hypothetical protein
MVIPKLGAFTVTRSAENGGDKSYTTPDEVEQDFMSGALHPGKSRSHLYCLLALFWVNFIRFVFFHSMSGFGVSTIYTILHTICAVVD